jgi:putative SOS response-associated peptidase YedK
MSHGPNKVRKERMAAGLPIYEPLSRIRKTAHVVPSLGELHQDDKAGHWIWAHCGNGLICTHSAALPLAPLIIRWGWNATRKYLCKALRCRVCGHKGGLIIRPSWIDIQVGVQPFPVHRMARAWGETVCNLYAITKGQAAIRDITRAMHDRTGNLPSLPAIFPDKMAPIVRGRGAERELLMARWGFPPPNIPGQKSRSAYLTNVRNTDSRYWRPFLTKPEHRCLVPATSFAEPDNNQGPRSIWTWFAREESRSLMFFAGIWREWEGERGPKSNREEGKHLLFSFLTTDASHDVAPVHSDATPVLLLDEEARERWMNAPWEEARDLQTPAPPGSLRIVATDTKQDQG